jgi:hypothetical protein
MTATSAVVEPDISEKNMEKTTTTCDKPPLMCPTSDTERFDQEEERDREQRFAVDAVKDLLDDRSQRHVS